MFFTFLNGWAKISKEEEYFTAREKYMKFTFQPPNVFLQHSAVHMHCYAYEQEGMELHELRCIHISSMAAYAYEQEGLKYLTICRKSWSTLH